MDIIETNLTFNGNYTVRNGSPGGIVLHHAAANGSVEAIHNGHLSRGYAGIGYHFYVRKDGSIYRGRPENWIGAHTVGHNEKLGICAEGNFETDNMSARQQTAISQVIAYLLQKYGQLRIYGHRDLDATACPGKDYPFQQIVDGAAAPEKPRAEVAYTREQFVRDVQAAIGAAVDGIPGPETLGKTVTVSRYKNDTHFVVVPIQKWLYALGYTQVGAADGIAGAMFQDALKDFQKDNGCIADGEATKGLLTWRKLLGMV